MLFQNLQVVMMAPSMGFHRLVNKPTLKVDEAKSGK